MKRRKIKDLKSGTMILCWIKDEENALYTDIDLETYDTITLKQAVKVFLNFHECDEDFFDEVLVLCEDGKFHFCLKDDEFEVVLT